KVIRLMPSLRVSSRSGGSRSPGAYTPSLTPSSSRSTVSSKAFPVRTARKTAAVIAGDPPGTFLAPEQEKAVATLRQRNAERLDHRRKYRALGGGPFGRYPPGGRLNERGEQAEVAALLGMPLHAEHESGETAQLGRSGLDRLDGAVFFPGHRLEPVAEQVDRLVVLGRHLEDLVPGQDRGQRAVRADPHVVQAEPTRRAAGPLVPVQ